MIRKAIHSIRTLFRAVSFYSEASLYALGSLLLSLSAEYFEASVFTQKTSFVSVILYAALGAFTAVFILIPLGLSFAKRAMSASRLAAVRREIAAYRKSQRYVLALVAAPTLEIARFSAFALTDMIVDSPSIAAATISLICALLTWLRSSAFVLAALHFVYSLGACAAAAYTGSISSALCCSILCTLAALYPAKISAWYAPIQSLLFTSKRRLSRS